MKGLENLLRASKMQMLVSIYIIFFVFVWSLSGHSPSLRNIIENVLIIALLAFAAMFYGMSYKCLEKSVKYFAQRHEVLRDVAAVIFPLNSKEKYALIISIAFIILGGLIAPYSNSNTYAAEVSSTLIAIGIAIPVFELERFYASVAYYFLKLKEALNSTLFQVLSTLLIVPLCTGLVPGILYLVTLPFGSVFPYKIATYFAAFYSVNLIVWFLTSIETGSLLKEANECMKKKLNEIKEQNSISNQHNDPVS